jgi:two-component system chemotaxis sensor kinase CheA
MSGEDNSAYRDLFVQEANEHVQNLNQSLLKLEEEPGKREHLDAAFRSAHTLKGMAATMGYEQIKQLCKAVEELFDKFRKGEQTITSGVASYLFKCFDAMQQMVADENFKIDIDQYLADLRKASEGPAAAVGDGDGSSTPAQPQLQVPEAPGAQAQEEAPLLPQQQEQPEQAAPAPSQSASPSSPQQQQQQQPASSTSALPQTIRVKMQDLDALVDLVGELLIAKMRLEQMVGNATADNRVRHTFMSLGRLVTDLQYQTMKLRLVPVEQIFNRFPRMIRDISSSQGKDIKFEMEGMGIELDRTVLDAITEPLLHMLRNAVDHGQETPDEREKAGKPRTGTIKLAASKVGDRVMIIVEDDGRGIDVERLKAKAVEKKLITREEAEAMTEEQALDLLGTPGLSTAKQVTDISGRGVGMDVVFSQIEAVGGQVKIETKKGKGSRFTLAIPLSLAIIGGLLVTIGEEKFVLPLSSVISTMRIEKRSVKLVHGTEVMMFRDQVVPLTRTDKILGLPSAGRDDTEYLTVVIVNKNGKPHGLIVDAFESKQEIVIKRLDSSGSASGASSEATILGDGKVALILDPAHL